MGPTMTEGWFSEIFGGTTTDLKATLLTLTSSTGRPTLPGAVPGGISDLTTLPDIEALSLQFSGISKKTGICA